MARQHTTPERPDTHTLGRIIAHRGASRIAPENTLTAFRKSAEQGARWLEFDVSLLGDGTPVLHHDATLDRCTGSTGPLDELAAADLAGIDAGGWFSEVYAGEPLATLADAIELFEALGLSANLEMKPHGARQEETARSVAAVLAHYSWTRDRILVSSFDVATLQALRRIMPTQPVAVLYDNPPEDWPSVLIELRACSLHVWHECLTVDVLARGQEHGFHVRVFTVNDPTRMEQFRGAGLTGVITDHPPLFLRDPDWSAWAEDQAE